MTLDQQLSSTLRGAASAVPYAPPSPPEVIMRRGRRRRVRRRLAMTIPAVLVGVGALAMTVPFDPNPRTPAAATGIHVVEIADLAVAVVDPDPVSTSPEIWLGLPGPTPSFDTSDFGPDLSFTHGEPDGEYLAERKAVRAVYLGDVGEEPFYLYAAPAPSIWDRIFEVVAGNFSGDTLGTSLNCCTGGDMDHEGGLPGFSYSYSTEEGDVTHEVIAAEWLGLSTEVSVLAYMADGAPVGWQTPVGGVASLRLDEVPEEAMTMIAFDRLGRELDRIEFPTFATPAEDRPVEPATTIPGSEWAPLEGDGNEIVAADISDPALRDLVEPLPTDRLFLIEMEGGELIVRVRGDSAHVFARSCDFLDSVTLPPGWEAACLE